MNYHNITKDDMLNGEGLRVVLWVAGCGHHCQQCHNPQTWDAQSGIPFDYAAKLELLDELSRDYISGITFSGGDPLFPGNRAEVTQLVSEIRENFPNKTIWLYTGYRWEEVCDLPVVQMCDVMVDGRYQKELRDPQLFWRGSGNQRIIDIPRTQSKGEIVLRPDPVMDGGRR